MSTVFVTGANGYIAQHLVKQLLDASYKVIGSVRSEQKGAALAQNVNNPNFSYEVIPDIIRPDAFDKVLQENPQIEGFFHTASPVVFGVSDYWNGIIEPAVEGTKNVITSVHKYGKNVKRFIYTSSIVAMNAPHDLKDGVMTEDTWCLIEKDQVDEFSAYTYSKTKAEKQVWEFYKSEHPSFDFNVINPGHVFGPQAFDAEVKDTLNHSAEIINACLKMKSDDPVCKEFGMVVDVRDIAKSHIVAYETSKYSCHRFLVVQERFTGQQVLDLINKQFPQLNLPKGIPGSGQKDLDTYPKVDDTKSRDLFGPYISLEQSVYDTVKQILDNRSN